MKPFCLSVCGAVFALLAFAEPASAAFLFGGSGTGVERLVVTTSSGSLTFNTSDSQIDPGIDNQGWWSATYPNLDFNDNVFVGDLGDGSLLNDFFTFDLSTLSEPALSATLELQRYAGSSPVETVTYQLFDVSTDTATLNSNVGTSAAIFTDLGSGTSYGSFPVSTGGGYFDILSFSLNAAALADINAAAGSFFSIGGTLSPSAEVPEPATLVLLTTGLGALLLHRRLRPPRRR